MIKKILNMLKDNKCKHENIVWFPKTMVAGDKQEGVCKDCGKHLYKNTDGTIEEK